MRGVLALIAFALTASPAHAAAGPRDRATLKGLPGVRVIVEDFSEQAKQAGFEKRTFQIDVELQLRMAGIKVLSPTEWSETPGRPLLYIGVGPQHERRGEKAVFGATLHLKQYVRLDRDQSIRSIAATWSQSWIGIGDIPYIRKGLRGYVDAFINAWFSVNPKPQERAP